MAFASFSDVKLLRDVTERGVGKSFIGADYAAITDVSNPRSIDNNKIY